MPGFGVCVHCGAEGGACELILGHVLVRSDVDAMAARLTGSEPLLTEGVRPALLRSLLALQRRLRDAANHRYLRHRTLRAHILPLTNATFSRGGDRCLTGSYDRTCKLWDVAAGQELRTFEGHKNVVFSVAFSNADE